LERFVGDFVGKGMRAVKGSRKSNVPGGRPLRQKPFATVRAARNFPAKWALLHCTRSLPFGLRNARARRALNPCYDLIGQPSCKGPRQYQLALSARILSIPAMSRAMWESKSAPLWTSVPAR